MTKIEQHSLVAYDRLLSKEKLNEDEKKRLKKLALYCLNNDLCISKIPERMKFTAEAEQDLYKYGLTGFAAYYSDILFVDKDDNIVDIKKIYYNKFPKELLYLKGIRSGLSHREASDFANGKLAPEY